MMDDDKMENEVDNLELQTWFCPINFENLALFKILAFYLETVLVLSQNTPFCTSLTAVTLNICSKNCLLACLE